MKLPNMKIAVIHNVVPLGGARRVVYEFAKRLKEKGNQVDIYELQLDFHKVNLYGKKLTKDEKLSFEKIADGYWTFPDPRINLRYLSIFAKIGIVRHFVKIIDIKRYVHQSKEVAKKIDQKGYDIAFVHNCTFTQFPPVAQFCHTPVVLYIHELNRYIHESLLYQRNKLWFKVLDRYYKKLLKNIEEKVIRNAHLILCNSNYTKEYVHLIYKVDPLVNYLGIDIELFKFQNKPKENMVLNVSTLGKNQLFVLEALKHVSMGKRPKVVFCYATKSPKLKQEIETIAEVYDIDVELHHALPDEEIVDLYNRAKIVIYPPRYEPFGLVPLEAMACGTPVIGLREAGIRETILDDITGYLINNDPKECANKILFLLENDEKREQLGEKGIKYVQEKWTWDHTISTFLSYVKNYVYKV